jgi:hypothetical protein
MRWKVIAMCAPVLPAMALILAFFIPDSPTYLVSRHLNGEARAALKNLFGSQFNIEKQAQYFQDLSIKYI